ncbi:sodium-dependent transporter [Aneurinibacillus sp. REN35]|uniref:sodium-dependent transporter n=1 Tax=Aneurinibacillus sp. REN35 TaxID=3237286 RepID=UPI0035271901
MEQREQWGTRAGFILAAVGSAVGLGNIWRFPYVAYENGGGAFLIPYFFALLTAGIPILILEFGLGKRGGGSAPLTFYRLSKKWEWLGWWQVMICLVISLYYGAIIAWAMSYIKFSATQAWGDDTQAFLFGDYLKLTENVWDIGGMQLQVLLPLTLVWAIVFITLYAGIKKGIETAGKFMLPLLLVLFAIIAIRSITLPGASVGLNHFFTPDWSKVWDYKTWLAAYGQIFFSLSVAFAIMITYSSYLPKKSDVNNNAFITAFSNSGFELFAGITVFSAIGFMAVQSNVPVSEVAAGGVGLAFIVFPKIISTLPAMNGIFGILFFGSLMLAGLTSLISIVEVIVAAFMNKFSLQRRNAAVIVCIIGYLGSLIFATGSGLHFLDIFDHFINNYGVALAGLAEVILLGWFYKKLTALREENNRVSDFAIGGWWEIMIRFVTPAVLLFIAYKNIVDEFAKPYGDYPWGVIAPLGLGVSVGALLLGLLFTVMKWHRVPSPHYEEDNQK